MNEGIYPTAKIVPRTILEMGADTKIGDFSFVSCGKLIMEEGSCVNRFCELQGRGTIHLGKHAQVASHASILTSVDTPWGSMSDMSEAEIRRIKTGDVHIGEEAFIGMYALILPGVTIGDGAVIGAYSYIEKDVEEGVIIHPRTTFVRKRRKADKCLQSYFERFDWCNKQHEKRVFIEEELGMEDRWSR